MPSAQQERSTSSSFSRRRFSARRLPLAVFGLRLRWRFPVSGIGRPIGRYSFGPYCCFSRIRAFFPRSARR
jgi:hypothetical protein